MASLSWRHDGGRRVPIPISHGPEGSMIAFAEESCRARRLVLIGDTVRSVFAVIWLEREVDRELLRLGCHVYVFRCP